MDNSKKPHETKKELVKSAAVAVIKAIGVASIANKFKSILLSYNSIECRIDLISEDILGQLIVALKKAGKSFLQTEGLGYSR